MENNLEVENSVIEKLPKGEYDGVVVYSEATNLTDASKIKAGFILIEEFQNQKLLDSLRDIHRVHITYTNNKKIIIDNKVINSLTLSDCKNITLVTNVDLELLEIANTTFKDIKLKKGSIEKVKIEDCEKNIDPISLVLSSKPNANFDIDNKDLLKKVNRSLEIPRHALETLSEIF